MAKKKDEANMVLCPVGRFFLDLERASGKQSNFFKHLKRSRVELLKAVRSVVDDRIQDLEKEEKTGEGKKTTRIRVE